MMFTYLTQQMTMQTPSHDGDCKSQRQNTGAKSIACVVIGIALLCVGGGIYVACRPATLLFVICSKILTTKVLMLPDFVIYNLPGGLWSASYMFIMYPLVRDEKRKRRIAIISIIPMLGIISELMQAIGWLPGTFDALDLLCYSLPIIIYLIITKRNKQPLHYE